jgi:hypothetical protein
MSKVNRPTHLDWWIGRGRKYDKFPPFACQDKQGNVHMLSDCWKGWWLSLQPAWRGSTWPLGNKIPANWDSNWGSLAHGGNNGLFLALISLAWWLAEVQENNGLLTDVQNAMDDLDWVLLQLLAEVNE